MNGSVYNVNQSCIYLDGIKSEYFGIKQCVAQACTLSQTLFVIFVDGLMKEILKVKFIFDFITA